MNTTTRLAALAASILVTVSIVSAIAEYAKPADVAAQLALRQAGPNAAEAARADRAALGAAVETR